MTVAAMAWVFKQTLPPIPKMVLLTLADQTDDATGSVCYGRTDLEHIAAKTSVSKRSLYRYIGALVRNGYLVRESGAEKRQPNQYWILFDRAPHDWQWFDAEEAETEREDDDGGAAEDSAKLAPIETGFTPVDSPDGTVDNRPPMGDTDGSACVPLLAHKESLDQSTKKDSASGAQKKSGFSKAAQDADRVRHAREREQAKPARYFVIEGSRAWDAWVAEMRRRTGLTSWNLSTWSMVDGKSRRGWYFPSLFPPQNKSTAPPGELSDEDARALMG